MVDVESETTRTCEDSDRSKAEHLAEYREQIEVQQAAAREKQTGRGFRQGTSGRSSWNGLPRGPTSDVKRTIRKIASGW